MNEKNNNILAQWCQTATGQRLFNSEQPVVNALLARCVGYYLLHLGYWPMTNAYSSSPIKHQVVLAETPVATQQRQLLCRFSELAIASDSVDTVYCPHLLEFVDNPQQVLREIERILVPEGYVLTSIFNPFSLMNFCRLMKFWRPELPHSTIIWEARLKDWLTLLGFELIKVERLAFFPYHQYPQLKKVVAAFDPIDRKWWQQGAAVFIVLARKKSVILTPLKYKWRLRSKIIAQGIAGPTAYPRR